MPTTQISGTIATGITLTGTAIYGDPLTITNTGSISGDSTGILATDSRGIDNFGGITAIGDHGNGVYLAAGGSVTNEAGGSIDGVYTGAVLAAGGTITNNGNISGTGDGGAGIALYSGGSITNSGTIGGTYGIYIGNGGSVTNEAGATISGTAFGITPSRLTPATNPVTITNLGTIVSTDGVGVRLGGTSATLENAGNITGGSGQAVYLNASTNRLIVDAGASFTGTVNAFAPSANTLELKAGAIAGTIVGLGSQYTGFETVTIDNGGTWTIGGTIGVTHTAFNNATIQGFGTNDRLDLTDLTYSAGDTFSLDANDLLTVKSAGGDTLATVQLAGDFTGEFFHLTSDGGTGSYITDDEDPACYCRGTMIRTDDGDVAVEDLKAGDRVITASGAAKPIRWIGRRSYSAKFAAGNANVLPICFKAGSLARNVPRRDLWVSPEHAMFIGGVLIPAKSLVNGRTVVKAAHVDTVDYFHIELHAHDVIIAEGALSETFVDDNSRGVFHNAHAFYAEHGNSPAKRGALFCAPRLEEGAEVEQARNAIAARAIRLEWRAKAA